LSYYGSNEDYIQNPDEEGNTRRTSSNDSRYFSLLRIVGYVIHPISENNLKPDQLEIASKFFSNKQSNNGSSNKLQYNHRLPMIPEVMAGAKDRAGFIEASDMNARKKMSSPTIPPMTSLPYPLNPLVYTIPKK
jgi:hypothetical protein